jgi:hypothetical protein
MTNPGGGPAEAVRPPLRSLEELAFPSAGR